MMGKTEFISQKEKYLKELKDNLKLRLMSRLAPVLNSPLTPKITRKTIDLIVTGLIFTFIVWSFCGLNPLRNGFGIAVLVTVLIYYIREYYRIKDKPWN